MRSGEWRTTDRQANAPIDASTVLPNGVAINGVVELRAQLADHPETFVQTVTEKLMMYAVNRQLEYFDMPQVRAIVRAAAQCRKTITSCLPSFWESSIAMRSASRVRSRSKAVATAAK